MGLPPVARGPGRYRAAAGSILGRRQALGVVLAILLLLAGREARRRLLVGPDGAWRNSLWLDQLVESAPATDPAEAPAGPASAPDGAASDMAAAGTGDPASVGPFPAAPREPGKATAPPHGRPAARPALNGPLPINSCSADSLLLLPGVGPVLAARIEEARRGGMIFRVPADLRRVKGIGPATMARLAPLVLFAGPAPDAAQPAQSSLKSKGSRPN